MADGDGVRREDLLMALEVAMTIVAAQARATAENIPASVSGPEALRALATAIEKTYSNMFVRGTA